MSLKYLLECIPSTDVASFGELCGALGADCPEKGDTDAWRELFQDLGELERGGFIEIERAHGRIDTLILTEDGVAELKQLRK